MSESTIGTPAPRIVNTTAASERVSRIPSSGRAGSRSRRSMSGMALAGLVSAMYAGANASPYTR